jgi:hypothetical protein
MIDDDWRLYQAYQAALPTLTDEQIERAIAILSEAMRKPPVVQTYPTQIFYTWYGPGRHRPILVSLDDSRRAGRKATLGIWVWPSLPLEWQLKAYQLAGVLTRASIPRVLHRGDASPIVRVDSELIAAFRQQAQPPGGDPVIH